MEMVSIREAWWRVRCLHLTSTTHLYTLNEWKDEQLNRLDQGLVEMGAKYVPTTGHPFIFSICSRRTRVQWTFITALSQLRDILLVPAVSVSTSRPVAMHAACQLTVKTAGAPGLSGEYRIASLLITATHPAWCLRQILARRACLGRGGGGRQGQHAGYA